MSRENDAPRERRVTTDRDQIERWAAEHDAVPVRRERGNETVVELVPESERRSTHEELDWDEFHRTMDDDDMVVAYDEDEAAFSVLRREEMMRQPHIDRDDIEEALLSGETVTATVTETTVVEQTIVEEATIESEIVDRQVVEETPIDAELITREVDHCTVANLDGAESTTDFGMFESGAESDDRVEVEVEVDEGWTVTNEVLEQLTIESRVVDTSTTGTETVESDTLEETIDVEGVEQTILEGDLLDADATTTDVVDSNCIRTQFPETEGDIVQTELLQRNTVEEEVSVRKEFRGEIGNARTITADTISSQTVASEIAEDEDLEAVVVQDEGMAVEGETTTDETMTEGTTTDTDETAVADTGETAAAPPTPTVEDGGKTVLDANGDEVGMVTDVEGSTMYVDPHPSLADRIRTALDWGGRGEDAYPLEADEIDQITDDEVRLRVQE